ncbi:hypothetical protein F1737_05390 [Methanoplanus sp. FWC-SCC4]|uniref:DUF169 domain-containing protein n=1 Tax=Methanochimaera problematica TaxID=2609417 RepID=A0AA97FC12_9EURY|nr:DUF169 domain-containing protein [Methanoplanus sp. FWC-SCC4]WOF16179.1 hypothetical protein F1737_05390 [Methanoplanus sp. FWC-SCC4]
MIDEMKNKPDYEKISQILVETLNLSQSPVAVKFAKSAEGLPEGVPEVEDTVRHCQMVASAGKDGKIFYATAGKHACAGGGWALGLKEITPSLQTGEFYYKLGKYESWAACMRTIQSVPYVHKTASTEPATYATVYAPLEKTPFDPHVVVIVAQPVVLLKFAQAILYKLGGRIQSEFSGIQSVCADACAQPYITGKPNISLGCDGSRKFSGIDDDLMVMGIPAELLEEITDAIPVVTGAAGSKLKK